MYEDLKKEYGDGGGGAHGDDGGGLELVGANDSPVRRIERSVQVKIHYKLGCDDI